MDNCTSVTPACPVSATTLGYYPNLGGNIFLLLVFAICALTQIYLGFRYRVRLYSALVFLGCAGEGVGYIGRLMLHANPWNNGGFIIQTLLLIVSPSFLAAALYLTVKTIVLTCGPQFSLLNPKLYTWLFIICDAIGFCTQLAGGGLQATAANGKGSESTVRVGTNIMIAGIAFQAATMAVCGVLTIDYTRKVYLHRRQQAGYTPLSWMSVSHSGFAGFVGCQTVAFVTILIRCIYRIPEMAGGWGNPMMQDETKFMILDGTMVAIGAILMTLAFPGVFLPAISSRHARGQHQKTGSRVTEEGLELTKGADGRSW
ncbi:RTA1 domain-containing protein [Aspergillus aculeatinus CBS 121060]|uniref:RTA1-domain-containing protein n=1 Tax=Aspergillus aculeatinus CBS 121060 TaxID=1448322 RepID=A0ACD1GVL9_9EURO|nr:RTA1-domain-containing protein [Aspergillus aculeatinus CBS 121060]RAH65223.1 RTA1-domain-containing protein [Aspergillus aculeatinus CBS 121060]